MHTSSSITIIAPEPSIEPALEKLKKDNNVPNGHHGKIMSNGDYVDKFGNVIDNIAGYMP